MSGALRRNVEDVEEKEKKEKNDKELNLLLNWFKLLIKARFIKFNPKAPK